MSLRWGGGGSMVVECVAVVVLSGQEAVMSLRTHTTRVCVCVSTDGLHAYTCMLTSSHPTRIVKQ